MRRAAVLFAALLALATWLWPWLRQLGLAGLPLDMSTVVQGYHLHLPVGTALLITAVIAGVWRLLDRP